MPAIAKLKVMPRGCVSCPFSDDAFFNECKCRLLYCNNIHYEPKVDYDISKQRRKECPLEFMDK